MKRYWCFKCCILKEASWNKNFSSLFKSFILEWNKLFRSKIKLKKYFLNIDLETPGIWWCCKLVVPSSLFNEVALDVIGENCVLEVSTGVVIPHSMRILSGSTLSVSMLGVCGMCGVIGPADFSKEIYYCQSTDIRQTLILKLRAISVPFLFSFALIWPFSAPILFSDPFFHNLYKKYLKN